MKQSIIFIFVLIFSSSISTAQPPHVSVGSLPAVVGSAYLGFTGTASTSGIPLGISPTSTSVASAQWHYAGHKNTTNSVDWIYSLVTTDKRETIACGYSAYPDNYGTIFKLDHLGNVVWSKEISASFTSMWQYDFTSSSLPTSGYASPTLETGVPTNSLWSITKSNDGYIAVGKSTGIVIVEVDENGNFINGTPIEILPPSVPTVGPALTSPSGHGFTVATNPNTNSAEDIIVGGFIQGTDPSSNPFQGGGIWELKYGPSYYGNTWSVQYAYYGGNGALTGNGYSGSLVSKLITRHEVGSPAGSYNIYACGAISSTYDNSAIPLTNNSSGTSITYDVYDKDIWLLKMDNHMTSVSASQFNKSNIKVMVGSTPTAINVAGAYTNTGIYPYQQVGPLTARNYATSGTYANNVGWWNPATSAFDYSSYASAYFDAANNKNEVAYDMTFTNDGNIAVIALVNVVGDNCKADLHELKSSPGITVNAATLSASFSYGEYVDGDAFLLKINPGDIGTSNIYTFSTSHSKAKNVGHFSGSDFFMQVKQDLESNYIVSGSTADIYGSTDYNLPDPEGNEQNALIVGASDNWSSGTTNLWMRSFIAADARATIAGPDPGEDDVEGCACIFALDLTADGGFVIGGNNDNNHDDQTVTKFAPLHQCLMKGLTPSTGGYYDFGLGYVPTSYNVGSSETWSSSRKIASLIIVPSGHTLNITGTSTNISFAASDQLWDYYQAPDVSAAAGIGCGIIVQPGGTLNVNGATLQGISITGEHNVWDGIVVQGDPTTSSTSAQGKAVLTAATIKDARYGLYSADNFRAYKQVTIGTVAGSFVGSTYSSRYDGTANKGGGIVNAVNYSTMPTSFLNCYVGAYFNNYTFPGTSYFTGCYFNCDATGLGDICFYTDKNASLLPSYIHLANLASGLLTLKDNVFTCNTSFPLSVRPYGVASLVSPLNVTSTSTGPGNTFSNLSYGVYHLSLLLGTPIPVNIANNTFTNNYFGIGVSGDGNGLIVQNNVFKIPHFSGYNATGVSLIGCHGYAVSGNTFDRITSGGPYGDIGTLVNDGTSNYETISDNYYNYVAQANVALQTNGDDGSTGSGLQYRCNQFNNSVQDIYRNSVIAGGTTVPATLRYEIGHSSTDPTKGAGNQFYSACSYSGSTERLDVDVNVTQVVNYYNNWASSYYDPSPCFSDASGYGLYSDHSNATSGGRPDPSVACPDPIYYDYSNPSNIVEWHGKLVTLDATISGTTDAYELAELQTEHSLLLAAMARYYAYDGYYDSAAALYASYNIYRDAFNYYFSAGDYTAANTMLGSLPVETDDDKLFAWEAGIAYGLYSTGQTWFNIDSMSLDSMKRIVQYNKPSGYMAGAVTALLGIRPVTWPEPVIDTIKIDSLIYLVDTNQHSGSRTSHNWNPIVNTNQIEDLFSVYPNPTFGNLKVKASKAGKLILYTILGQMINQYDVVEGKTDLQLPTGLAPGVYMVKYKSVGGSATHELRLVYTP